MRFPAVYLTVLTGLSAISVNAQPPGYAYGKQLSVDAGQVSGSSDLANFPMLVSFTDADLRTEANAGHVANANGYDIIFVTAPCTPYTVLDHQLESYDPATGALVAWVRIPSLSASTDTQIYMFYGNSGVSIDPSTTSVWNTNYRAVYFLDNDFTDKTSNSHDATNNGTVNNASSKIGGGATFGTGDYVQAPTAGISLSAFTFSAWVNSAGFVASPRYILGHTTTPVFNNRIQLYVDDAGGNLDLGLGNSHFLATNIYTFSTAQWYRLSLSWNGSTYRVYVNNAQVNSGSYTGLSALETYIDIGNNGNAANRNEAWAGDIDGVVFYNAEMPADWLFTEYNNQNDPSSFYSVTAEYTAAAICSALPIELKEFEASVSGDAVKLYWSTYSEENNALFTIERSGDGMRWEKIAEQPGAGTTTSLHTYTAYDRRPLPGRSYYRLKQTDYDGTFTYSENRAVVFKDLSQAVSLYPNPVADVLVVDSQHQAIQSLSLHSLSGMQIDVPIQWLSATSVECNFTGVPAGVYFLRLVVNGLSTTRKVVVGRKD